MRGVLQATGAVALPALVDVDWRLDYVVRSSGAGSENAPAYFVTLKTREPDGSLRDVEFVATPEHMAEMLDTVRLATKQVAMFQPS